MRDVQLLSSKAFLGFLNYDPCVMATRANSTKFSDCGYLVCLRPFPAAGHITKAFSKFTE